MRIAVALLLIAHGGIHLIGVHRPWRLGVAWLAASLVLFAAGALRLAAVEAWWVAAIPGVVLSQVLVVLQWHDAKAGTVANVVIGAAVILAAAAARFERQGDDEARALLARASSSPATVLRAEELERLPAPVRRWLEVSGVVGRERARSVRLRQRGLMRTSPDGAWMPARAEQYFAVDDPGFVWKVDVTMMRVLPIAGRDTYAGGKGRMLIELASLLPVVDGRGDKIDQGALLRFLGEIVWFPSAALGACIAWEEIDAAHARATMTHGGVSASAVFAFDERGRFSSLSADRYFGGDAASKLERWDVPVSEWRVIRGVEIPVKGDVVWKLEAGDFSYFRWEILDVEPNRPELYATDPKW